MRVRFMFMTKRPLIVYVTRKCSYIEWVNDLEVCSDRWMHVPMCKCLCVRMYDIVSKFAVPVIGCQLRPDAPAPVSTSQLWAQTPSKQPLFQASPPVQAALLHYRWMISLSSSVARKGSQSLRTKEGSEPRGSNREDEASLWSLRGHLRWPALQHSHRCRRHHQPMWVGIQGFYVGVEKGEETTTGGTQRDQPGRRQPVLSPMWLTSWIY